MSNLYILCGIPASGKTFWANNHCTHAYFPDGHTVDAHISRDTIRAQLLSKKFDDISSLSSTQYFSMEKEVFNEFVSQIANAIDEEIENIYVDATNINRASRDKLFKTLAKKRIAFWEDCRCIAVIFLTNASEAIERDNARQGFSHVGTSVIERFERSIEWPEKHSKKELFQFDELEIII